MFRGHKNIFNGGQCNFLYKNGFYKIVQNVIIFSGNQKYQTHVHGDDIALQLLYFDLFMMKQYIRINPDV